MKGNFIKLTDKGKQAIHQLLIPNTQYPILNLMSRIISLLKEKCPNCEEGDVFKDKGSVFKFRLPLMYKNCKVCNFYFEREPGYYWGAMYFSYALAIAEAFGVFLLGWFLFDDPFNYRTVILILVAVLLLSFVNLRISRMLWMYMFTGKRR